MGTQSLTVVNDNLFKQVVLLLAKDLQRNTGSAWCGDLQACAGLAFAIPFLFFAAIAGDLADRGSKRAVVIRCKLVEFAVMLVASAAFFTESFGFLVFVLFLMGTQSAFLGPAKYGALVEMLERKELGKGNGIMQAFVLGSILLGMGFAGKLYNWGEATAEQDSRFWILGLVYAVIALIGAWLACGLPRIPAAAPERKIRWNPMPSTLAGWSLARNTRGLRVAIFGHALYWLVGAILVFAWNAMGDELGQEEGAWTARLAGFTLSTALGCALAGRWTRDRVSLRLPLVGGLGLSLSFFAVAVSPPSPSWIWFELLAGGFFAGLYLIPLRTLVQRLPDAAQTGRALGFSQLCDWMGIVLASFVFSGLRGAGLSAQECFWALGAFLLLGVVVLRTWPPPQQSAADLAAAEPASS